MEFRFLEDALSPVAKEIGNQLADLVSLAFTPITKAKIKRDYNLELFKHTLNEKLKAIPIDNLTEARPSIVGPILEDVGKFYHDEEYLRELFASLIASSMNKEKQKSVHLSFKRIIEELSSDEAKLLRYLFKHPYFKNYRFPLVGVKYISEQVIDEKDGAIIKKLSNNEISIIGTHKSIKDFDLGFTLTNYVSLDGFNAKCEYPESFPQYIENLMRLKLVDAILGKNLYHYETEYAAIIKSSYMDTIIRKSYFAQNQLESYYGFPLNYYEITEFGKQFLLCCIGD